MNDFLERFCCFLYDALQAEYFSYNEIVSWADGLILQCEVPKPWLVCLSLIKSKEGRYSLFDEVNGDLAEELQKNCSRAEYKSCFEGFLFLRYIKGNLTKNDLLDFYIEMTTHEDVLWEDLLPEMQRQASQAVEFLSLMQKADIYLAAPWIFDYAPMS